MRNFLWSMVILAGVAEITNSGSYGAVELLACALVYELFRWAYDIIRKDLDN